LSPYLLALMECVSYRFLNGLEIRDIHEVRIRSTKLAQKSPASRGQSLNNYLGDKLIWTNVVGLPTLQGRRSLILMTLSHGSDRMYWK
jgi:hypothetical protein